MDYGENFAIRIEAEADPLIYDKRNPKETSAAKAGRFIPADADPAPEPRTINTKIRAKSKRLIKDNMGNQRVQRITGYISLRFENEGLTIDHNEFVTWDGAKYRINDILYKPTTKPWYIRFEAIYDN